MPKGQRRKAKKAGRPSKPKQRKDFNFKYRVGYWPHNTSVKRQLDHVIRSHGILPDRLASLAEKLPSQCKVPYSRNVGLKQSGAKAFEVTGAEAESSMKEIAAEITKMSIFAPNPEARAWILKTKGDCKQHIDYDLKGVFSLVVCIRTIAPYQMEFSRNRFQEGRVFRTIEMKQYSYVVFPSVLFHRCTTDDTNCRTVLNVLVKAP